MAHARLEPIDPTALREEKGITPAALARALGCHRSSVGRWESKQQEPPASVVYKWGAALGLDDAETAALARWWSA